MAINSEDKRRSTLSDPSKLELPKPSGSVNTDDRRHVSSNYRGPLAVSAQSVKNWFDINWTRRIKIVIDNGDIPEKFTDFPVTVKLTTSRVDYTLIQGAGQDLRPVAADNVTILDYEIEKFNASGDTFLHVRIPEILANEDCIFFYIYFGNPSASDAQNQSGVWNSNYLATWHMAQDPSGTPPQILDATSNNVDMTSLGSMTSGDLVAAKVGDGLDFDGAGDALENTTFLDSSSLSAITIDVLFKTDDLGVLFFVGAGFTVVEASVDNPGGADPGVIRWQISTSSTTNFIIRTDGKPFNDDIFHLFTGTYNTSDDQMILYVDGEEITRITRAAAFPSFPTSSTCRIGKRPTNTGPYEGIIDEERVSDVARSANYVKATFRSLFDLYLEYGAIEFVSNFFVSILSPDYTTELEAFTRNPILLVKATITGTVAGETVFRFCQKEAPPLSIQLGQDVRSYILGNPRGRPTKIAPDRALTERARMSINFKDDPNAPPFDSAVFNITTGGSFWRRLVVAQPDYIGSKLEILRGFVKSGFTEDKFVRIFKGRIEDIDFGTQDRVTVIAKDDFTFVDREVPSEISDGNLINGAILIGDNTFTVDNGNEITDPDSLGDSAVTASRDFFPIILRLDPDTAKEDVIIRSKSGNVVTIQQNHADKSEDFSDATWVKTGVVVTSNFSAGPFGGAAVAELLTFASISDTISQTTSLATANSSQVHAIWLKGSPNIASPGTMVIDILRSDLTLLASKTVNLTDAWRRFQVSTTFPAGGGTTIIRIRRTAGDDNAVLAFGASLETGTLSRGFYAATDGNAGNAAGRGAFGSTAAGHADDIAFREVVLYHQHLDQTAGIHPVFIIRDLINRGQISPDEVDQGTFDVEVDFIPSSEMRRSETGSTAIDRPRNLLTHIKEVREQGLIDIWQGEDGLVKTRLSFRNNLPGTVVTTLTDEDNLIERSTSYQGNAESRITRVVINFNPIAGSEANKPEDFNNRQVSVDLGIELASGPKVKVIFSKWLFQGIDAVALGGRLISRFRRGARIASWGLDLRNDNDINTGDVVFLDSQDILVGTTGSASRSATSWQVIQKTDRRDQGMIKVLALQSSGRRYAIISPDEDLETPPDAFPDYPAASGSERQYGFIGDANNLVNVGQEEGYFIL